MLTQFDEARHLMSTLIFTLGVITESTDDARRQIAEAYSEARTFAASIPCEDGSARPRIEACILRFREYLAAEQVEDAA